MQVEENFIELVNKHSFDCIAYKKLLKLLSNRESWIDLQDRRICFGLGFLAQGILGVS